MQYDEHPMRFDKPEETVRLTTIKDLGIVGLKNILESVSDGKICLEVFHIAWERVQQKQVEQFFKLIAKHSKSGDEAQLLVDLAKGLDTPHVYNAIISGYQAMQTCADEIMKGPLAVLVGQQIYREEFDTAYFRSASQLLTNCRGETGTHLRSLANETKILSETWEKSTNSAPYIAICEKALEGFDGGTFWVSARTGQSEEAGFRSGKILSLGNCNDEIERLLTQHGFASPISGLSGIAMHENTQGSIWMNLDPNRLKWFEGLSDCLNALSE